MHPENRQKRSKRMGRAQRGAALVTSLIMLSVLGVTTAGLMSLVGNAMSGAQKRTDTTEAFNMADSGLDMGKSWLTQQAAPPDAKGLSFGATSFFGTNGTLTNPFGVASEATATLQIVIYADDTNDSSVQKHYLIQSTATMPSGATQTVREYVQQSSFGKYAYFAVNDGGGFWDYNNHFEGPVHFNDGVNGSTGQSTFLWKSPANWNAATDSPIFTYTGADAFSVSDDVTWWKDNLFATGAPSSTADWSDVAVGGQSTVTTGFKKDGNGNPILDGNGNKIPNSPAIPLPTTSYQQQYAALGDPVPAGAPGTDPNAPATNGVNINTDKGFNKDGKTVTGGLYIHGDSAMALSVNSSGNQVISVTQNGVTQNVTIDLKNNQTIIDTPGVDKHGNPVDPTQTMNGAINGMVYSDGNITALSGTVADNVTDGSGNLVTRSQLTIATDLANSKDITLTGSLKYNTTRDLTKAQSADTNFNQKAGILGILGHHVQVGPNAGSNIEFDGSIFATTTFDYPNYATGGPKGNMTSIGGVITHDAGYFANVYGNGTIANGYNEQYHYDSRLADHPPPFFPTTGSQYDILSWQRVTTAL